MCARFVEEYGRFESALSGTNDENLLVAEPAEVAMLGRVGDERCWKIFEHLRFISERLDTSGDYHSPCVNHVSVLQSELVTVRQWVGSHDFALVQRHRNLLAEPVAVLYEIRQWNRIRQVVLAHLFVNIQTQATLRVGNMGARPRRTQGHLRWHVALPERHGLAKEQDVQALQLAEMGSRRQAVWASTDDCEITFFHAVKDLLMFVDERRLIGQIKTGFGI